ESGDLDEREGAGVQAAVDLFALPERQDLLQDRPVPDSQAGERVLGRGINVGLDGRCHHQTPLWSSGTGQVSHEASTPPQLSRWPTARASPATDDPRDAVQLFTRPRRPLTATIKPPTSRTAMRILLLCARSQPLNAIR